MLYFYYFILLIFFQKFNITIVEYCSMLYFSYFTFLIFIQNFYFIILKTMKKTINKYTSIFKFTNNGESYIIEKTRIQQNDFNNNMLLYKRVSYIKKFTINKTFHDDISFPLHYANEMKNILKESKKLGPLCQNKINNEHTYYIFCNDNIKLSFSNENYYNENIQRNNIPIINTNNKKLTKKNSNHQLKKFKTLPICHEKKNNDNISISENNQNIKSNKLASHDICTYVNKTTLETVLYNKTNTNTKPKHKRKNKKVVILDNVSYFKFYSNHSILEDFNQIKNTNKIDINEKEDCKPLRKRKLEESVNNSLNNLNKKRNIIKKRIKKFLNNNGINSMKKKKNNQIINKLKSTDNNTNMYKIIIETILNDKNKFKAKTKSKDKKVRISDNVSYFEFYSDHSILEDFNQIKNTNKIDINENENCKPLRKRKLENSINNSLNNSNKKRNIIKKSRKSCLKSNSIKSMKKKNNHNIKINKLKKNNNNNNINGFKLIFETNLNDKNTTKTQTKK